MIEKEIKPDSNYSQWYEEYQAVNLINQVMRNLVHTFEKYVRIMDKSAKHPLREEILHYIGEMRADLMVFYKLYGKSVEFEQRKAVLMADHYLRMVKKYLENPDFFWHEQRLTQCMNLLAEVKKELNPFAKAIKTADSTNYFFYSEGNLLERIQKLIRSDQLINRESEIDRIIEDLGVNRQFLFNLMYELLGEAEEIDISSLVNPVLSYQSSLIEALRKIDVETIQKIADVYRMTLDEGRFLLLKLKKNPNLKINISTRQARGHSTNLRITEPSDLNMRSDNLKSLLTAIHPSDPKSVKDIVARSGLSVNTIRNRLPILLREGLLIKRKNGRYNFYQRTDAGTDKLTQIEQNEGNTQYSLESNVYRL